MSNLIRVGVLRGGPGPEYALSYNSGLDILNALTDNYSNKYDVHDILIDDKGKWFINNSHIQPHELHNRVDVVFNALRGSYGEDGRIQSIFETYGLPFTGSSSLGSALSLNKLLAKEILKKNGLKSPYFQELSAEDICLHLEKLHKELFYKLLLPVIVKPTKGGSSVGASLVKEYGQLPQALREAALHSDKVLIEEYIRGSEASCGVIDDFRGQEFYVLPPVEIKSPKGLHDHADKVNEEPVCYIPASFSLETKKQLEKLATEVHQLFGLRHYSKTDFMIHPRRGIYVLEVDSLPTLTHNSLLPKALKAVGSNLAELVDHVIGMALGK